METSPTTAVIRALADPTRRTLLERIARSGEISVVDLTDGSGVTQGAVSQHLKALKRSGLVDVRAQGRNAYYRARPNGLGPLVEWLDTYARYWSDRLDDLERALRQDDLDRAGSGRDHLTEKGEKP